MFGCCLGKEKKYKKAEGKETETENNKGPGRHFQQEIGNDTNSSIVTSGARPRNKIPPRNSPTEDSGRKKTSLREELVHRRKEKTEHGNSSTSSSDSFDDNSDDFHKQMDALAAAGNQGQGGNNVIESRGGKGHTFNVSYTGENIQFGQKSSIKIYNISKDIKEKKEKSKRIQERGPDVTPFCKESARIPTSSSCPDETSEIKVEKMPKSQNEASTSDDQAMTVPRCLGHPSVSSSGNMKAQFDETETVHNHRLLAHIAKSVGIIKSPYGLSGTGFRVGSKYIMTAKHVKDDILNAAPGELSKLSPPPRINHLSDAFIDFSNEVQGIPTDDNLKFYFEPKIVYENDDMDTVILQLKPNTRMEYPLPLTSFAELSEPKGELYFIGHSRADIKKTDKFCCVQLTNEEKTNAEQWSLRHAGVKGFVGIDNPQRVLFHCTFEKGASGSPGVWICRNNHRAYIVTMLLRGYPDWYYDKDCPSEKKHGIPHNHLVEQGVCMRSLCEDIKVTDQDLWREIFNFNSPMSQDGDDVEMKSV